MKTIFKNRTAPVFENGNIGVIDNKGRQVGWVVRREEVDAVEDEKAVFWHGNLEVGHWFAARVSVARDGESFGAIKPEKFFRTDVERQAWIEKRIAGIIKSNPQEKFQ